MSIGKFEGCNDSELGEYLHSLTMEGCDSELGNTEDFGWYGLLENINGHSYIVFEDNAGFFSYTEYANKNAVLDAWALLELDYEDFMSKSES